VAKPVERVGVLTTYGRPETIAAARARLEETAAEAGVEVADVEEGALDLVVVLGGDGTMLRALGATLGTETPVLGVNYGRVGFLTTVEGEHLESALPRALAGEFRVVDLCTLDVRVDGETRPAVNDLVVTSSAPGRMVDLGWEVGGEELSEQPCDGIICATPSGSTGYNLSNGGPVLMWGLEAMAISFVAPHSVRQRPLVVPRGVGLRIENRSDDLPVTVLVDGDAVGELEAGGAVEVAVGEKRCRLAVLPEVTFLSRYHAVFA
jgi:NAD+ kinase